MNGPTIVNIQTHGKLTHLYLLVYTSNSYNTPARDTLHLYDRARGPQARGRGQTNAMYPAAGVLSTNLLGVSKARANAHAQ